MRRATAFGIALGYALSWIVVCLSTCLMESPAAPHGCCPEETGIRAVPRDCCAVAPTARPNPVPVVGVPPIASAARMPLAAVSPVADAFPLPVRAAASPPLVLRI